MKRIRQTYSPRLRTKLRKRITITVSCVVMVMGVGVFISLNLTQPKEAYGAVNGDYRTKTSGNWNSQTTWEKYNGTTWIPAVATPTSADGVIEILSGHTVTVTASVTADQVIVDAGGSVTVNSTKILTIANGAGTDLDVSGTIRVNDNSKVAPSGGAAFLFNASSIFEVNWTSTTLTAGVIPTATWNAASTVKLIGFTTVTGNSDFGQLQHLGNVIYDCPNQSVIFNLYYTFMSNDVVGDISLQGDFTVISTGTGSILTGTVTASNQVIAGDFIIQGGTIVSTNTGNRTLNINGDFSMSGGTWHFMDNTGNYTLNITGNCSISGGTLDMSQYAGGSAGSGVGTLNLYGNLTQTGGTITETASSAGRGEIYFKKSGTQTFSKTAGTMSNTVNYTVTNGAILDAGTSVISGGGTFGVSSGGGLIIGSTVGITSSGATGNIQVSGTRTYSTSANYTYEGNAAQVSGNGLPATVNNLILNNSNNLTLTNTVSVSGILNLSDGQLITGSNEIKVTNSASSSISGYDSSSYIVGNLRRYVNSSGSYDFPIGSSTNYEFLNTTLSSSTGFTNILGSFTQSNPIDPTLPLSGVTVNGMAVVDMLDYGYWTLTPNSSMTGGTYSVHLEEIGESNAAAVDTDHCVLKRTNASSVWQSLGIHDKTKQQKIGNKVKAERSGYSSFSQFGIGKKANGLPIELIYFNAKLTNGAVDLSWATASELNNDHFTIERSSDGIRFDELLRKPGTGNSTNTLYYSAADENPLQGYSYYRLKQTDYDGHFTYSETRTVKYKSKDDAALKITSISPNPFTEKFTVSFTLKEAVTVDFLVNNSSGQTAFKDIIHANEGMNQYDFNDEQGLPRGIYFLTLFYNNEKTTQKIIKN